MRITVLKRFKLILDESNGTRRISLRFRTLTRPKQINLTITRYQPNRAAGRGVS